MRKLLLASLLLIASSLICLGQTGNPMLISRLTVNQTHIAFQYAGDIWAVERGGGEARRLTTDPAERVTRSIHRTGRRWLSQD